MIAYPYYLLAFGIIVFIIGAILSGMIRTSSREPRVHANMRDADIARQLRYRAPIPFPNIVMAVGMLCIAASICWRLARMIG